MCLLPTQFSTHATVLIEQVPVFQHQGGPAVIHVLRRNGIDTRCNETQSFCKRTPGVIDEGLKQWHPGPWCPSRAHGAPRPLRQYRGRKRSLLSMQDRTANRHCQSDYRNSIETCVAHTRRQPSNPGFIRLQGTTAVHGSSCSQV